MPKSLLEHTLGPAWDELAPVIRRHYDLHGKARIRMRGEMDRVSYTGFGRLLRPILSLMGVLVPCSGEYIPVTVENWGGEEKPALHWRRTFRFPGHPPILYCSRMRPAGEGEIIEDVGLGLGIRLAIEARQGGIRMVDRGYLFALGAGQIPLPLRWVLGRIELEEKPINDDEFSIRLDIVHPWFGPTFHYSGKFSLAPPPSSLAGSAPQHRRPNSE